MGLTPNSDASENYIGCYNRLIIYQAQLATINTFLAELDADIKYRHEVEGHSITPTPSYLVNLRAYTVAYKDTIAERCNHYLNYLQRPENKPNLHD